MKRALSVVLLVFAALAVAAPPAPAFQATSARYYDVQRLEDDLYVLQDSLVALPTSHARYNEFADRADALRQEVLRLKDDVDRRGQSAVSRATVDRLRDRIHVLHVDIDNALNRGYSRPTSGLTLAEGTEVNVRLEQALSSKTARVEDRFDATVARPVYVDGRIVIPDGSRVQGTVTVVERAQRPARGGRLNLSFDRLYLDDGSTVDLSARIVQVHEDFGSGGTVKQGAIGAAIGGILGKVIGGTKGAIVGVLLGGAGGAISSSGDDVELPAGTVFTLQLDRPTTVPRP